MFITDTSGNKSLTATMAIIGFAVVMIKVLMNGAAVGSISFGTIDSLSIAAILGPILGTYTARRWGTSTQESNDAGSKPGDGAA